MSHLEGQCLCGQVAYTLERPLRDVIVCHCGQCRRWHGHVGAYTNVPKSQFRLVLSAGLAWFASSEAARRGFCKACGSSLFWERTDGDAISVAAGTLTAPTGLDTRLQIFTEYRGDYYALDPAVPCRAPADDKPPG
jgi:hypothetical protein